MCTEGSVTLTSFRYPSSSGQPSVSYLYALSSVPAHAFFRTKLCIPAVAPCRLARNSTDRILTHAKAFSKRGDGCVAPALLRARPHRNPDLLRKNSGSDGA